MRTSRARFTLRSIMAAIAMLAVVLCVAERRLRFQRLAEYYFLRSSADIVSCVVLTVDGEETVLVEGGTGAPTTTARAAWHRSLCEKYCKAARFPWLPVAADPPRPR